MELRYKDKTLSGGSSETPSTDAGEVYSTEEQVIGTWINTKPLYRAVVKFDRTMDTDDHEVGIYPNTDVKLINAYGYVSMTNSNTYTVPMYSSDNMRIMVFQTPNKQITASFKFASESGNSSEFCIVLEYTKTTD